MIEIDEARQRASELLAEYRESVGVPLSFYAGQFGVAEYDSYDDVWVFNWNSAAYLASGSIFDQVIMGPIAVPKDGSGAFGLGTSGTTDLELQRWRDRRDSASGDQ